MKVSTSDLLNILRKFQLADGDDVPRLIDQVSQSHPNAINQLVAFRFKRAHFFALFDETATDRTEYIMQQIETVRSEPKGELLANPHTDFATYGLPYKGKDVYLYRLDHGKKRLDVWLAETYPETSRSSWQKHIKASRIKVNTATVTQPKFEISPSDKIVVSLPDAPDFSDRSLPILYQDDDVIVINKPAGVLSHAKNPLDDEFTVEIFLQRYASPELAEFRFGLVHRLDRDTSGVMIGARTLAAYDHLKKQFADRSVTKTYVAILDSIPAETDFRIDIPIARNPAKPGSFMGHQQGKPAVTDVHVVKTHTHLAYVELHPHTGRTHQLRVHLAYLGTPIHGDRLYGKSADRLYLHAHGLVINLPSGETESFISPTPPEFDHLMEAA